MGGGADAPPANTQQIQSSRTVQELPGFVQPYAEEFLRRVGTASGREYVPYEGERLAGFTPYHEQAVQGQFSAITPGLGDINQSRRAFSDTATGQYLHPGTNPYLQDTYNQAARDVVDQYRLGTAAQTDAAAARAGALGGSAYNELTQLNQYGLGQNLKNLATDIYGQNYQQERARMLQSAGALPALAPAEQALWQPTYAFGDLVRSYNQDALDLAYANFREQQDFPLQNLDIFGSGIAQSIGRGGTSTTTAAAPAYQPYRSNPYASALGGALAGYGATGGNIYGGVAGGALGGLAGFG